jgi:hypothetical protein
VAAYRWTGSEATGTITPLNIPAGAAFALVNGGPVTVPWAFLDKYGFTSPQAGEFLKAGVDLNALFGANVPRYVTILAETRSSTSTTATQSDFALGRVNAIQTSYIVHAGPYSNTVTVTGVDQGTNTQVSASDANYHYGTASGPQLAATVPPRSAGAVPALTAAELAPIVTEAEALWVAAGASPLVLGSARVRIADLPDGSASQPPTLGYTDGAVLIDVTAGGFGWFIDPTPADNAEFAGTGRSGYLAASAGSPAFGRMDLLTVVLHELGHVLGLEDLGSAADAHDLMATTLLPGERRLPGRGDLPILPTALGAAGAATAAVAAPAPTSGDSHADRVDTTPVSASSGQSPGTPAGPSAVAVPGVVREVRRGPVPAGTTFSALDLAPLAVVPGKRPDWQTGGEPVARQGGGRSPGAADRRDLDAFFTTYSLGKPPIKQGISAKSGSLLPELDEEMLAEVARSRGDGLPAPRRSS